MVKAVEKADLPFLLQEVPAAIGHSLEGIDTVARLLRSMNEYAHPANRERQIVELNRIVETALTVCRGQWKHVADAVTELDPSLPPVVCAPDDLLQVLANLIINAAHAIEERLGDAPAGKGTITIRTGHRAGGVEIHVEDTGTGIPEQIRDRVFDRFFTSKSPGRGTGQGLAIVRSIVAERCGGTIHFTTRVGQGTTFVVRLPIESDAVLCKGPVKE